MLVIAALVFTIVGLPKKCEAAAGMALGNFFVSAAGLALLSCGFIFAEGNDLKNTIFVVSAAIVGLVLMANDQGMLEFNKISPEEGGKFNFDPNELNAYNASLADSNARYQTAQTQLREKLKRNANFYNENNEALTALADSIWADNFADHDPLAVSALNKIRKHLADQTKRTLQAQHI